MAKFENLGVVKWKDWCNTEKTENLIVEKIEPIELVKPVEKNIQPKWDELFEEIDSFDIKKSEPKIINQPSEPNYKFRLFKKCSSK